MPVVPSRGLGLGGRTLFGLFKKRTREPIQDGKSEGTAFRLPGCGSALAIAMEYEIMAKLFGREGTDWRVQDRIRWSNGAGREFEKFICETRTGREVVHFDITEVLASEDPEPVQAVIDAAMERQGSRSLTITLPKGPFVVLCHVLDQVGGELTTDQFNAEDVLLQIAETTAEHPIATSQEFPVTLSVADWLHVGSITGMIRIPNEMAQEHLNDLGAYVRGALKEAGPG